MTFPRSLLLGTVALLLSALPTAAQTRFSAQTHLSIESQPSVGFEQPEYLGLGDSVRVLGSAAPGPVDKRISAAMRREFVYVSYPAYRDQPAGQGWVLRRGLVGARDSLLLDLPPVVGPTLITKEVITTRRYVPVRPAAPAKPGRAKSNHP